MQIIVFYLLYSLVWAISLLPLKVLYFLSDILYLLIYYVVGYRKKVVLQNLRNSFPEKSEKEIQVIAKKFFRYFSDILVETVKLITISKKELTGRIKYSNPEVLYDLYDKKKQVIVVLGHYGNWEWLLGVTTATPYHSMSVYKPLTNKFLEDKITKIRSRYGSDLVPMRNTIRVMLQYVRDNKLTISAFIADQRPFHTDIHYWIKFLNQETPVLLGAEKIARQINAAVVFMSINRFKRGYYNINIEKLTENAAETPLYEITDGFMRELEKNIIEKPQYWLWTHKRWKYKKK
jgi:KDO2-lipid IV(A) lauroyltransferase